MIITGVHYLLQHNNTRISHPLDRAPSPFILMCTSVPPSELWPTVTFHASARLVQMTCMRLLGKARHDGKQ